MVASDRLMVEIIDRKRRGEALSDEQIQAVVSGYVAGTIPDYQMAAWLMAVVWRDMDDRETAALTGAMTESGEIIDLRDVAPMVVDKHSTGGVGDKATLVVGPLVAAAGVPVGKMSGRGLGHTGGTIDKLESIEGIQLTLDGEAFKRVLRDERLVIVGQSARLAPADGLIYALRDATATVASIPLIASSIMSKKLAAGATAILLDVKVGRGAFMEQLAEARRLAELMVAIGERAGRRTRAILTGMDQPLGRAVGNALEVREAIATLRGEGPAELTELCVHEAGILLAMAGAEPDAAAGERRARRELATGAAFERFVGMVRAQRGDWRQVTEPARLPRAPEQRGMESRRGGWVGAIDALAIGRAVVRLGGGRRQKGEAIDWRVGIELAVVQGDRVEAGDRLLTIHAADAAGALAVEDELRAALVLSDEPVGPAILVHGEIGPDR